MRNLYNRGLTGQRLALVVSDCCPRLAAALQVVYPQALHQRCSAHKTRNILERVRRKHLDAAKTEAQAIYQAPTRSQARDALGRFKRHWGEHHPAMVKQLQKDLPELLAFFSFHPMLWLAS